MKEFKFKAYVDTSLGGKILLCDSDFYSIGDFFNDVEGCEIMQYTGLKDKTGTEIYEGDIIEDDAGTKYKIVFNKSSFKVQDLEYPNGILYLLENYFLDHIKVVGNIYENKE